MPRPGLLSTGLLQSNEKSPKVVSDISIFEAFLVASRGQQGQELLASEGKGYCLYEVGLLPSSPDRTATSGIPGASVMAAQWEIQNAEATDVKDAPKGTFCLPLVHTVIY